MPAAGKGPAQAGIVGRSCMQRHLQIVLFQAPDRPGSAAAGAHGIDDNCPLIPDQGLHEAQAAHRQFQYGNGRLIGQPLFEDFGNPVADPVVAEQGIAQADDHGFRPRPALQGRLLFTLNGHWRATRASDRPSWARTTTSRGISPGRAWVAQEKQGS
jgi:hypothetical protein